MKVIKYKDKQYPNLLKEISDFPNTLYTEGDIECLNENCITVIGSRNMTEYGRNITKNIVKELVDSGLCIVSGMAVGIDSVAHKTCLENNGKTIAVLGSALNRIFPPENVDLFKNIVKSGGCVISEHPQGVVAQKRFFVQRNRIVSGLSLATLVIEATYRSGTSITANYALKQGRKLFCIPNCIGNKNSAGIINLLKKGAKLVTNAGEILSELDLKPTNSNIDKTEDAKKRKWIKKMEEQELENQEEIVKRIYYFIKENGCINIEMICNSFKMDIAKVNVNLTILELKGLVENCYGLYYKVSDTFYV